jgi:N-acetylneuraminic acid mutarotase
MRPMTLLSRGLRFLRSLLGGASRTMPIAGGILLLASALVLIGQTTQTWTLLAPVGSPPVARMIHSAVYSQANNRMIAFGGFAGDPDSGSCGPSCLNDVWVLANADGTGGSPSWTQLSPTGTPPSARGYHSAVLDAVNNRMVVFAGDPRIGFCSGAVNDVWVLTNADGTGGAPSWAQLNPSGIPPNLRQGPRAVYDSATNRMIVFGGMTNACGTASNAVWVLTNANGLDGAPAWTQLSPIGPGPAARGSHTSVYDAGSNRMIVFGGTTATGFVNDVWVLANANGLGGTPTWTQLSPAGGSPTARSSHSAVYDPATQRMVVFGGQAAGDLSNQIWELTNANGLGGTPVWSQRTPAGSPPVARDAHTAVLNTATNRMTVYAGRTCVAGDCFGVGDAWVLTGAVAPVATTLTLAPAVGIYSGSTDLQATLSSSDGGISGATVSFTIDGLPVGSATTNSSGVATLSGVSLDGRNAGAYPGIVDASFAGTPNFQSSSGTGDLEVSRATPSIAWPFPAPITYAAPLGPAQLNASATFNSSPLEGTFVYAPAAGTVLNAGISTLSTSFEPIDTVNYESVWANALITVNPSGTSTTVQSSSAGPSVFGASGTFTATVAAVAPGTGMPAGSVQFKDNGVPIGGAVALAGGVATINSSTLTVGSHTITADYLGNGNYNPSAGSLTQTVSQASSSTTIVSSASPSVFGQSVTLTATVAAVPPSSGIPTGTVTFSNGGTFIVSATLDGTGHATVVTGTLPVGSHVITAAYSGDAGFAASAAQSPAWQQLVPTGAGPDVNSQQFVSDKQGNLIMFGGCGPTGCNGSTGTFSLRNAFGVGGTPQWVQIPTAGGNPGARHAHVLAYDSLLNELIVSGGCAGGCFPVANSTWKLTNGNGLGTGTPTWSQVITPAPPANGFIVGQFAAVDPAHGALMIFGGQNGGGSACSTTGATETIDTSTFSWASLPTSGGPPGAQYLATGGYDPGSNRLIVANGWGCGLFNELWVLTHANGKDTGFTPTWTKLLNQGAAGSPPGGPAFGRADYSPTRNTMFLIEGGSPSVPRLWRLSHANGLNAGGGAATPVWTLAATTGAPLGASNVGGIAYDEASDRIIAQLTVGSSIQYWILKGASGSGAPISQAVTQASTTTSLASGLNTSTPGQPVTFTATVAVAAPGSGMPTGDVTFKDGATTLGTGTLSAGTATFTTASLAVGAHAITATYAGDSNFTASTSSTLSHAVSRADTMTTVTSSRNPSVFGQSVTFTAAVAGMAPGAGTPSGAVTFKNGATTLGAGTLGAGTASLTTTGLSAGSHVITAVYDGDVNFTTSTSSALAQVVTPATPVITVTGGTFVANGSPHPATATATNASTSNPVAGTFTFTYAPGGASAPVTPGRYAAAASFTSGVPGFTNVSAWTTMAPDPHLKSSPAVVEIDGKLYVQGFDQDANGNQSSFVPRLSIYDPASNTWALGASPTLIRAYASVGVIAGKMYVVGGCVLSDCAHVTNALEIYDPVHDTWSNGPAMPTARFGAAAGVIGGKLYVTGGSVPWYTATNATEIYDPVAQAWTTGTAIPTSRELPMTAVVAGELYVIGGYQREPVNGPVGQVDVYNPATGWSTRSVMPTARYAGAVGAINGEIYVVGGYGSGGLATSESYNPATDTWTEQAPMPTARFSVSGGVVNSKLYVIDGSNGAQLGTNEVFDPSLTTLITITPAPAPVALFTANPNPAACGQPLTFNGSGSRASPGFGITAYAWDFGDGSSASGQSLTHSYGSYGTYTATLTVTDDSVPSMTAATTQTITVNQGNVAPFAHAGGSYIVTYGGSVQLNGGNSSDSNAGCGDQIASYAWTIDGTISLSGPTPTLNTAVNPLSVGVHGVSLTVTDTFGATSTSSTVVTVRPTLVSIEVNPSIATIGVGGQPSFQAIGHFNDGSTALLPSGVTGGGGSGQGPAFWSMHLTPGLNIDACATSQYPASMFTGGISIHGFTPDTSGAVHTTWSTSTPVVHFDGTITPAEVNLTLTCAEASAAIGSLHATWTGLRYEGTATFNGGATTSQVSITGWSHKAPKPTGRFGLAAVSFGGKVFAIGGVEGSCGDIVPCSLIGPSTTVESYNPTTDTWIAEPSLSVGREGAGAAALGGKIYVVGGHVPGGEPSGAVEVFDSSSNSWTLLPQSEWMPTPRAGFALVTDGRYLFAIGGSTEGANGGHVATLERYDPLAHTWSTLTPMPVAGTASAGVLNGTIVVFGSDGTTRTDVYDIATDMWHSGVPMPAQRGGMAVAAANGGLWLAGGTSNGSLTYDAWVYYPAMGMNPEGFASLGTMLTARSQAAAASVGDVVFLVGGMAFGPNPVLGLRANEALSTPPFGDLSTNQGPSGVGSPSAVLWQTTNASVATVDQSGKATGVTTGNTTIVASAGSITCLPDHCGALTVINTVPSVQLFGGPFNTNESQFQNFSSGGNFSDPDPQDWTVTVDYGDGTGMHTLPLFNLQPGHNPTAQFSLNHAYRDNGVFTLTVTIDDHAGGLGTATAQVTVNNVAPQVSLPMTPPTTQLGSQQNFGCAALFDRGTFDAPWSVTVDYGDGAGPQAVTNLLGSCGGSGGADLIGAFNLSHVYTSTGTFTVTTTATDKDGGVGTGTTSVTVNRAMPSMNVTASPFTTTTYGQTVTFTATVTTSLPGVPAPTGTVTFTVDGAQVAAPSLVSGQASYSTSSLSVGSHNIVATYGGDVNFNSASRNTSRFVGRITPSMTLASSSSSSTVGQTVTFTATVADPNGVVTATGPVTFTVDGSQLASPTLVNGQATFSTSSLSLGGHNIAANYGGDANFFSQSRSISQSVDACQGSVRGTILNHGAPFAGLVQFIVTTSGDTFPFTAGNGAFYFDEVEEGTYHLQVVPPSGYTATPSEIDFTVACGGETALIFQVADATPPVITLLGANPMTVELGTAFSDPGATATDAIAGNLTPAIVATGVVDTSHVGRYTRTYAVSDGDNSSTGSRTVNVVDTTPPSFTSPPNATITANSPAGATYFYTTPVATDAAGPVTAVCSPAPGSVFPIGTTVVACTATDQAGNRTTHTFTVTVLSPQEVIANLISQIDGLDFQQANNQLQNVLKSLDRQNTGAACNQLAAFINQVQAQSGHQLTAAASAGLIQSATDARGALGCP